MRHRSRRVPLPTTRSAPRARGWPARARHVRIVEARDPRLRGDAARRRRRPRRTSCRRDDEARAAFALQLNAVNFGSGWFPTLRKPPGLSGFRTVEAGLRAHGPWTADELRAIDAARRSPRRSAQDPDHELMALFARALRELGARVAPSTAARSSRSPARRRLGRRARRASSPRCPTLARRLALRRRAGPVLQARADRRRRPAPAGHRAGGDLAALTLFADNLVPHVLRIDGVLAFDPALVARIDREELLEHGTPEEVEIRACAVHAVELLVAAHGATTATAVDNALWHRGGGAALQGAPAPPRADDRLLNAVAAPEVAERRPARRRPSRRGTPPPSTSRSGWRSRRRAARRRSARAPIARAAGRAGRRPRSTPRRSRGSRARGRTRCRA